LGNRTLEEHFREQAELIDRLFVYRFEEFDEKWDATLDFKLANLEGKLEARLETKFDAKFEPIKRDLAVIKHAVK
jgi:hypothetical protein